MFPLPLSCLLILPTRVPIRISLSFQCISFNVTYDVYSLEMCLCVSIATATSGPSTIRKDEQQRETDAINREGEERQKGREIRQRHHLRHTTVTANVTARREERGRRRAESGVHPILTAHISITRAAVQPQHDDLLHENRLLRTNAGK